MRIKLVDIDSTMPNLALMKLSHYYKNNGCAVDLSKTLINSLFNNNDYDLIYGSAIFNFEKTEKKIRNLRRISDIIIGGTGSDNLETIENRIKIESYEHYDYSIYPDYKFSVGYTQRGCRFNCPFCVVPKKEGDNISINSIYDIWREGTERKVHLIDNDFFGQEFWLDRCKEIVDGNFLICIDQGVNFRTLSDEQIKWLGKIDFRNRNFKYKSLYTAWDNLKDEKRFLNSLDKVVKVVKSTDILCYLLIGFKKETDEELEHRAKKIMERRVYMYPMIYGGNQNPDYERLNLFRKWIMTRSCWVIPFDKFTKEDGIKKKIEKTRLF